MNSLLFALAEMIAALLSTLFFDPQRPFWLKVAGASLLSIISLIVILLGVCVYNFSNRSKRPT